MSNGWPSTTVATSPSRTFAPSTGTRARSSGVEIGRICCTPSRWFGVSIQPPVPGKEAFKNVRGDTHRESPVVLMICSWVMPWARSRSGSICTWSCRSRWPQIETLATPGTPIRRGLIVQRASTDSSIRESFFEDTPIIIVRLVADTGLSITGRCDTFGNMYDRISRSCTSCRACSKLVPG